MSSIKPKQGWFLAFTAAFAVLAGFVFWGTWSMDVVPVMPDAQTTFAADYVSRCWRYIWESGRIIPFDFIGFLGSPYLWVELRYVLALYLAALGMVYLCRGRGLSRLASYGAGLLLGFCGYWMTLFSAGHLGWFQWMAHGVFAFGLADRAVRKGKLRHWLLLGAVVAWAGYNQQDLWLLFSVFTTIYFAWCCYRESKLPWKGMLIAIATFAVVYLPNIQGSLAVVKGRKEQIDLGHNITQSGASDAEKRWEFVTNWSMPTDDTLEFFDSRVHGDTSCPFVLSINGHKGVRPYVGALGRPMNAKQGNYRQHSLYVGVITCLLALTGLFAIPRRFVLARRSDALFFAVVGVVFYLLSLGRYCEPTYRVIFSLPIGDLIRCPVKWHHLTEFCLVVLAAYGIERLSSIKSLDVEVIGGLRRGTIAVGAIVLLGALNLSWNARPYCAPVSVREARRTNSTMQLTLMPKAQFSDPKVASMVRAGRIVSVARYFAHPDYYVVGVLDRITPAKNGSITPWTATCTAVSLLIIFGLAALGCTDLANRRI